MKNITRLGITDVVLRDAHQSLFATRLRLDDMLPIAEKLDAVGYWSLETWGGATFDACIRFLGEDPWVRIRELKKAIPNTPMQMLLRGQNILGYRHYADDVVTKFVERAAINGVDVFRVFDAMNDMRNISTALKAVKSVGKHAQGTISYTSSPVHTAEKWVEQGKIIEDMGADSIAIKDMAGLLTPYEGFELVTKLKAACDIPIHLHCHATTGLSTATYLKCIEAGVDNVDTSISSMSMTYGHSPTEALVAMLDQTERSTELNLQLLESIAGYFRKIRKKYAKFEGALKGIDSRILVAQVPGGMLTNMENQLREQQAEDQMDDVLQEIPKVREDLGYIPLVTPTSQIVGTQAVINVLSGERYKSITKETAGILKGEYGITPAPVNEELQQKVLKGEAPITCRPADLLENELDHLADELQKLSIADQITLNSGETFFDDVLTYALFPQIGLKFLKNRGNASAFEPAPTGRERSGVTSDNGESIYTVEVEGQAYTVTVNDGGDITGIVSLVDCDLKSPETTDQSTVKSDSIDAPLAGNIVKILAVEGQEIKAGDRLIVLEAMKMETDVTAAQSGKVLSIAVREGDSVAVGDLLITYSPIAQH